MVYCDVWYLPLSTSRDSRVALVMVVILACDRAHACLCCSVCHSARDTHGREGDASALDAPEVFAAGPADTNPRFGCAGAGGRADHPQDVSEEFGHLVSLRNLSHGLNVDIFSYVVLVVVVGIVVVGIVVELIVREHIGHHARSGQGIQSTRNSVRQPS